MSAAGLLRREPGVHRRVLGYAERPCPADGKRREEETAAEAQEEEHEEAAVTQVEPLTDPSLQTFPHHLPPINTFKPKANKHTSSLLRSARGRRNTTKVESKS
ncbi:hypothetical protein L3Q82_005717 [Scortum barcoo]|uniref:Uncharacterized protein n=1 Tax=Scortum barcoo TaxID=214431 RepID=A0ACB8V691_9TELE|nr:hypothetical protein L3Q82_005717 [Scortum barcoo]